MTETKELRPAIFLDRDGTLVEEVNFLSRVEDLVIYPFAKEALRVLSEAGFALFVVTNQSGIGRGLFTEAAMHKIHEVLEKEFDRLIQGFYYCPHLPDAGCECRKPKTALLEHAAEEHGIDLANSWFVGDKDLDIETGQNAGMSTCLVSTGYGISHKEGLKAEPTIFASDLGEAAVKIASFRKA